MSKCTFCNKEIILIPSATERAKKYGGSPSDYTKLFTSHSECLIEYRNKEANELMKKINKENGVLSIGQIRLNNLRLLIK